MFVFDFTFSSSTFIFKVLTQFLIRILVDIRLTVHLRAHVLYKEVNMCVCVRISWVLIRIPTSLISFFDVLLTVHLSIFILVINQLDALNLFYDKFISCLYMFRALCAPRQEVKIVLYSIWYHHTL